MTQDRDTKRRYEVELQVGSTDEAHIVRTIEYWDIERKRYPQYDHCAVLIAEDITSRFLNVISLFNGMVPFIAIQMQALGFIADMEGSNLHWDQCLENALLAIELTSRVDNPLSEVFAQLWAGRALAAKGKEIESVRKHAEAAVAAAERLHDHVWLPVTLGVIGILYIDWGDWQSARGLLDRGFDLAPDNPRVLPNRAFMEYQLGDFDQGEMDLERYLSVAVGRVRVSGNVAMFVAMVARISGTNDRFDIAEAAAADYLSSSSVTVSGAAAARIGIAMMAIQRSHGAAAAGQYLALERFRDTMLFVISADHLLGLLSQTTGNLDQAVAHFEDGLIFIRV